MAAWVGTLLIWAALPKNSPVPPDRLQMFCSLIMVLLWVWAAAERAPRLVWRVAAGLAVFGLPVFVVAGVAAVGSGAGWIAGVVAGVLGALEPSGVAAFVSVVSEFCAVADGLLVPAPSHPNL